MRYIKKFLIFLENITNIKKLKDWNIKYIHNLSHDLNDRLKRTNITDFNSILLIIIK